MANRLLFLGLGAALMYYYDPQAGRRRRAGLMDQLASAQRRLEHGREVVVRDARNRMDGLKAETRHALEAGKREGWKSASTSLVSLAQDSAFAWRRRRWSPAQRALAGAGGAALATIGYLRGGVRGVAMCALGSALTDTESSAARASVSSISASPSAADANAAPPRHGSRNRRSLVFDIDARKPLRAAFG